VNEQELGKEIAKLLDLGTGEIKQSTLYRLQSARRAALENYQPTLEIINSGNDLSLLGGHNQHFNFNIGKLLLVSIVLFAFAVISATYWQFLEKNKSSIDTTILVDDLPTETYYIDNTRELDDNLSIDDYIDNVRKLVDDFSADAGIESEPEPESELKDMSTDVRAEPELELEDVEDDVPTEGRIDIDNAPELENDVSTEARVDNDLDEWLDSNK
jgi:hypothetical protein